MLCRCEWAGLCSDAALFYYWTVGSIVEGDQPEPPEGTKNLDTNHSKLSQLEVEVASQALRRDPRHVLDKRPCESPASTAAAFSSYFPAH